MRAESRWRSRRRQQNTPRLRCLPLLRPLKLVCVWLCCDVMLPPCGVVDSVLVYVSKTLYFLLFRYFTTISSLMVHITAVFHLVISTGCVLVMSCEHWRKAVSLKGQIKVFIAIFTPSVNTTFICKVCT